MKKPKLILTIFLFCLWTTGLFPQARIIVPDSLLLPDDLNFTEQAPRQHHRNGNITCSCCSVGFLPENVRITQWRIDPRTGDRFWAPSDTTLHNFQHTTIPDGHSIAMGHLGAIGSPSFNKIFFEKGEMPHFVFNRAYEPYLRTPSNNLFMSTRVPYAHLNYQRSPFSFGTTAPTQEDRFRARLTSNFGRQLNVALDAEILDARGFYNEQGVRHTNFGISGNYLSERVEVHGFLNLGTMGQVENGGLQDANAVRMITHPHEFERFTSRNIPIRFNGRGLTWNRVGNNQFFVSGRYNLGYRIRRTVEADPLHDAPPENGFNGYTDFDDFSDFNGSNGLNDNGYNGYFEPVERAPRVELGEFVPVASINFTSHYTQQFRRFLSHDTTLVQHEGMWMRNFDRFYLDRAPFLYEGHPDDSIRFSSLRNVVALSLREGFHDWAQFGLTAFLEHEMRYFSMREEGGEPFDRMEHRENAVTLGGVLSRQQGENLRFNIRADLGVLGANLGEFRAMGNIETGFNIAGRRTTLAADAHIKNLRPRFLQQTFRTKYFHWDEKFGDTRRVFVGGRLHIPFTNTTLSAGVENIQNFIYFDRYRNITQESANVQVLSGRIDQRFRFGIFNWDNHVVYQLSSNDEVIPLPTIALYSNIYLQTMIARVLTFQFGVDAHFHTRYFAPGYEPALLQFYNQREMQIGNFPVATIYANMHLSQTRFFLMWYNAASHVIRPVEAFTVPMYPINPRGLRVGVSVNLHN